MDLWSIFYQVLPVLITVVGGFALYAAKAYLKTHLNHMDIHKKEALLNNINSIVLDAIFYAEQTAKNIEKNQLSSLKSSDKLEIAKEQALEELEKSGITTMSPLDVQKKIEIILGSSTFEENKNLQNIVKQIGVEKEHLGNQEE